MIFDKFYDFIKTHGQRWIREMTLSQLIKEPSVSKR
jgi:hypothetical protein